MLFKIVFSSCPWSVGTQTTTSSPNTKHIGMNSDVTKSSVAMPLPRPVVHRCFPTFLKSANRRLQAFQITTSLRNFPFGENCGNLPERTTADPIIHFIQNLTFPCLLLYCQLPTHFVRGLRPHR